MCKGNRTMKQRQQKAFSLAELTMCVCLIGIILSIAPMTWGFLIRNNQEQASRDALLAHLVQVRTLSITTQRPHVLCGSSDGNTCDGQWARHWLIITPHDNRVHQRHQPHHASSICWSGFSQQVQYAPNGTSPTSNGRFALCREKTPAWQLVINRQGRVRLASTTEEANCCTTDHTGG
ncbi:type IV fimbrial biogenesis protein FimT [Pseudomonas sp. NFPP33]|nr:type IV fimbrial biogenesis protein FimT [Pseudomonas sp. NFPP33]